VSGLVRCPACHPERSEGSGEPAVEILRCAQDDMPYLQISSLGPRFRTHVRKPGENMHALDILDRGYTLLFEKISEVAERERVPFKGLWTMVLATMVE